MDLIYFPATVLTQPTELVVNFDEELIVRATELDKIRNLHGGLGLAAPQAGWRASVVVWQVPPRNHVVMLVNPVIEWEGEVREVALESCLSIPGVSVPVERATMVRVAGHTPWDSQERIMASGVEARVVQHELDHLDGILTLDRTTRAARRHALRAYKHGRKK